MNAEPEVLAAECAQVARAALGDRAARFPLLA